MQRRQALRTLFGVALAAPLVGTAPAAAASTGTAVAREASGAERCQELQRLLDDVHAAGVPGAVTQVRDGYRTYPLATGVADLATGEPAHPWLRHRVGGVIKTFVATSVLKLVGERRIHLDAPISAYLPDLVPGERGQQITVRMLLNHTSGIDDYALKVLLASPERILDTATRTYQPRELVRIGLELPPTGPIGTFWSYSNTNYIILGLLIERITGRPYGTEVARCVLRPLELRDTYLPGTDPRIRGPHLRAYIPWSDGTLRDFTTFNMSWAWAAGELISTTADLNRFFRALLSGRLLEPALLREMRTTVPFNPSFPEAGGYGLGIYWTATPCGRQWGHNGLAIGQTTYSAHSEDGTTTQVTLAENLNFYQDPTQPQPHPIDAARQSFLGAAGCGPAPAAAGNPMIHFGYRSSWS